MSNKISRRDFLKVSGIGVTAAAVLTGCGPSSRYVVRQAYAEMPEYNQTGKSTYYATTCRECPAGCGIIMRTVEGRAIKAEGNPDHPVNKGKLCSRGLTSVQGLYNPDRIGGPQHRSRGTMNFNPMEWQEAIDVVKQGLSDPAKMAFLMGLEPDHLFDLASEICEATGAAAPLRYSTYGTSEARATLVQASKNVFGSEQLPQFDLSEADVVLSFGANFFETWLSPVAYSRKYRQMRRQKFGKRGYMVSIEARQTLTGANADEWLPVIPGSEGLVALAIGKVAAETKKMNVPGMFATIDIQAVAKASGISEEKLTALGKKFAEAERPLALPGGAALSTSNGLLNAEAILKLNVLADNLGKPGGVFLTTGNSTIATMADMQQLIDKMNAGQVDTLFIHGTNPVFELPLASGFKEALKKVKTVISFSSFEDETAVQSDYVFPDHTGLESFGYQRVLAGSDRPALSSIQPVVQPVHNTKATADVLLAAAAASGGNLAKVIQYTDEVDFLQQKILPYIQAGGFYTAAELPTFWSKWLQYGGWWKKEAGLRAPSNMAKMDEALQISSPKVVEEGSAFHLVTFFTQLGDGRGANRPWLQETPDPMTTVTWNSWIEIHPETAEKMGIENDDIVEVKPIDGGNSIEAIVYKFPAIRPDTIAIPFGQGHEVLGRFAEGRGVNPAQIWTTTTNQAGDLALADTVVTITKTGRRRPLARQESKAGVYGDGEH